MDWNSNVKFNQLLCVKYLAFFLVHVPENKVAQFQLHILWLLSIRAETVILYIYQQSGTEGQKSTTGNEMWPSSQERRLQAGEASEE